MSFLYKKYLLTSLLILGYVFSWSQQSVQLGKKSFKLPSNPECMYDDKYIGREVITKNFMVIKHDSIYSYDVSYSKILKNQVIGVEVESGALADIDFSLSEIELNDTAERTCKYAVFLYAYPSSNDGLFYLNSYNESGTKKVTRHRTILIFTDDGELLKKIRSSLKK